MRVKRDQRPRYGRGNLAAAKSAIAARAGVATAAYLMEWAKSRQKTARQKG